MAEVLRLRARASASPSRIEARIEPASCIPPKESSGLLPAYEMSAEKHIFVLEVELTAHIAEETHVILPDGALFFEVKAPYRLCNAGKHLCACMTVMVRKG